MAHNEDSPTRRLHRDSPSARSPFASFAILGASALYGLARMASWSEDRDVSIGKKTPPPEPDDASGADASGAAASFDAREAPLTEAAPDATPRRTTLVHASPPGRLGRRRLAGALVFTTLFFGGAALSAVAGDAVSSLTGSGQVPGATCEEPAAAPAEEGPTPDGPGDGCAPEETTGGDDAGPPSGPDGESTPIETAPIEEAEPPDETSPPSSPPMAPAPPDSGGTPPDGGSAAPGGPPSPGPSADTGGHADDPPVVDVERQPDAPTSIDPEADDRQAVVWLHRTLPDPTPPAKRLAPRFARELRAVAMRHEIGWALLLGVVRAHGHSGRVPVDTTRLAEIAGRLGRERAALGPGRNWLAVLRYSGRTAFADRALALARYNRAVGLEGLIRGLRAVQPALETLVLADSAIEIYPSGRGDIAAGRTDVRILVLLRYLRSAHGGVTVSSLSSGHRVYSRPGVVSAHVYGLAVDISALGGRSIAGNQAPNGLTERAVRNLLLLPAELAPQQVISLLGLGGASFPLSDHDDHIHVGY